MPSPLPWRYPYQRDAPRQREVFRPLVSVQLVGRDVSTPVLALVDSGCDHILAAPWVIQDAAIDLGEPKYEIELGIGGDDVQVSFVDATMRLLHPESVDDDDYLEWSTEVGAVDKWRAPSPVLLGQHDFMSHFTVSMHRAAALLVGSKSGMPSTNDSESTLVRRTSTPLVSRPEADSLSRRRVGDLCGALGRALANPQLVRGRRRSLRITGTFTVR